MRPPDVDSLIEKLHVVPVFERLDVDVLAVMVQHLLAQAEGDVVHRNKPESVIIDKSRGRLRVQVLCFMYGPERTPFEDRNIVQT